MILVQKVSKNFGSVKAVDDVSFEINTGEVVGFLGPNGAGKSTTMRMICGYFPASSGTITVCGHDISKDAIKAKSNIGYLPESAALYTDMTVVDSLMFMGGMRGLKVGYLKERLRVVTGQCHLKNVLTRPIGELSKGYRQRVGLAQALLHDPKILILDEPTVGLDPNQVGEIRALIREIGQNKTILLSTHILPEVEATCSRVIIISGGRVVAEGKPNELGKSIGANVYQIRLKASASEVEKRFARIKSVTRVHMTEQNDDHCSLEASFDEPRDVSEDIFDLAVSESWKILGLSKKQESLEDVFKNLTR